MNYTSQDVDSNGNPKPRGEICYRGLNVFKGYYKQPELTKETIDADGWVHTGDIGQFNVTHGTLMIIDRKKNILKLSQGEYVAPEKLEMRIQQSLFISQALVYGDSLQHYMVAVVVPERLVMEKWASNQGIKFDSYEDWLSTDLQAKKVILEEITARCKEAGFFGFEIPQKVHLTSQQFSQENGLLTPTFKVKRNDAKKYFLQEIK